MSFGIAQLHTLDAVCSVSMEISSNRLICREFSRVANCRESSGKFACHSQCLCTFPCIHGIASLFSDGKLQQFASDNMFEYTTLKYCRLELLNSSGLTTAQTWHERRLSARQKVLAFG